MFVTQASGELVQQRAQMEGDWSGRNDELFDHLAQPMALLVEIDGRSARMDRDGRSRRAACEVIIMRAADVQVEL